MPTYWYRCQKCKYEFEEMQKITDSPVKECPKCGGLVMRVITGGAGLIFKGSGFYITDYRSESYKKAESAEKTSSSSSSSSSSSKKDSK
jgi:putative FmdB family regulatory protein